VRIVQVLLQQSGRQPEIGFVKAEKGVAVVAHSVAKHPRKHTLIVTRRATRTTERGNTLANLQNKHYLLTVKELINFISFTIGERNCLANGENVIATFHRCFKR